MKRRDMERELGAMFMEATGVLAACPKGTLWRGIWPNGEESEPCKVVGVMLFVVDGLPEAPGFVLESLDGNRLYTCTRARAEGPQAEAA